jgi:hypothetical protein
MKRLSLLFALSIVLLSFGLANAITFSVEVNPATEFQHPDDMNYYFMGNTPTYLQISMGNDDGYDHTGYSQPHDIYSTNGAGTPIVWIDAGGAAQGWTNSEGSIVGLNGWDDNSYMGMMNEIFTSSWDGSLPDYFNHTTASMTGWPDGDPELPRFQLHFQVPTSGTDPLTDIVEICIDNTNGFGDPTYDWLFPTTQDFGGPYCFQFLTVPNLPPVVNNTDVALSTPHDVAFDVTYDITDVEGDPITGVGAIDESNNPIGTATLVGGDINWTFDPPCSWVTDGLSHTVRLYAEDGAHGQVYPAVALTDPISLTVTNDAPTIDVCPDPLIAAVDALATYDFDASDANVGDPLTFSIGVAPMPAGAYSIDASTGVFNFTPVEADKDITFTFTITVTDCAGATGECVWDVTAKQSGTFAIAIEYEDGDGSAPGHYLGQHAIVDVFKINGASLMYGFDFLIAYDNSALALFGAFPNEDLFFEDGRCGWEYFTWRFVNNCGGSCPSGLVQVVAIADQNDGMMFDEICAEVPGVNGTPYTLFSLDFFVSNDYTLECSFVPIYFYWTDCGDNSIAFHNTTMADPLCIKQAVSNMIYSPVGEPDVPYNVNDPEAGGFVTLYDPYAIFEGDDTWMYGPAFDMDDGSGHNYEAPGFPSIYGAPWLPCNPMGFGDPRMDLCEQQFPGDEDPKWPLRFIDFFNGGIKIVCSDDIDARGDINLNGIFNEIADAVVFTNYFIFGMDAFTINVEGQKAATDVNADGIPLSVADLVYLIRVITGDVLPIPKLNPNAVEAHFGQSDMLITSDVELGAALFVLEGMVDVSLAQDASHMQIKSSVVNGNTNVLVYSFDKGASCSGNILNTEGKILSVEAADYNGSAYKTIALPTTFSVSNYPNPFNPVANIQMALPVASNWNLVIYNVAGQKVAEFSGYAEAGINTVVWDASSSASGIYFYKVTTDEGSVTKKMVLLK